MEHSVEMAYNALQDFAHGVKKSKPGSKQQNTKPSKVAEDPSFIACIDEIERQRDFKKAFPTHPKMEKLRALAIQHFARAEIAEENKALPGDEPAKSSTKMIVYCSFRDCVDEITAMLNEQQPMIRAHRFIGQGADKRGAKGVSQKNQIAVSPTAGCLPVLTRK